MTMTFYYWQCDSHVREARLSDKLSDFAGSRAL